MKKILIILSVFLGLILPAFAKDVMPTHISSVNTNTLGVYQAGKEITLYDEPREGANIVTHISWEGDNIFPDNKKFEDVFIVYLPKKDLALLAVIDETEDWVRVIYDNTNGLSGWMKKDDPYKFMSWISFFNIYGRKYGLYLFRNVDDKYKKLYPAPNEIKPALDDFYYPKHIALWLISGDWILVKMTGYDNVTKTGWMRWRLDNKGLIVFPKFK